MGRKHRLLRLMHILPFILMLACILLFGLHARNMTVDQLLAVIPRNYFCAALVLLFLYALKALSVLFPIVVLQICAGLVFPWPLAIAVNLAGALIEVSLPYWVGRCTGSEAIEALFQKYPRARGVTHLYQGRELFFSFVLRAVSCLPIDVVSLLLGSMGIAYQKYLLGSAMGIFPGLIAATVLGRTMTRPGSPVFWLALAALGAIALLSVFLYRHMLKKQS